MISLIIKKIKNRQLKAYKEKILNYIEIGNSFLHHNFRLHEFQPSPVGKKSVKIGNDSILDCTILLNSADAAIIVGNYNWIGASTIVCKHRIDIDNYVFISWGCYISDHDSHSLSYLNRQEDLKQQIKNYRNNKPLLLDKNWEVVNAKPIKICSNAWIGMNCIILKGVTVGEGAVVAAGSVITKDVPAWTVVAGNPARVVKVLTK